jgi:hypothetical protein
MSSKPAKQATESSAASKKKRTARKKVTKTTARKKAAPGSSPKKKKVARKKAASRKTSAKKASRKGALRKSAATDTDTATENEDKSISWMSAQATSALKAVKANQAVKGQAVLAKNKKHKTRQPLDDASLIEIADGMPVDDAALIEFSAEDQQQEPVQMPAKETHETRAESSDAATVSPEQQSSTADEAKTPETATRSEEIQAEQGSPETPPETPSKTPASMPPPPLGEQQSTRWPALLAVVMVVVTLAYVYWAGDEDGTLMGAITEMYRTKDEPATVVTAVPAEEETALSPSLSKTDTPDEPEMPSEATPPAVTVDTWKPARMPPAVTPSTPALVPAGTAAIAAEQPSPEPAMAAQPAPGPVVDEQSLPEPAVVEQQTPAPTVVAQPAPRSATPAEAPTAAAPAATTPSTAAPAPGGYRNPGYGYYPQSRQPAYPPQYYRQYR